MNIQEIITRMLHTRIAAIIAGLAMLLASCSSNTDWAEDYDIEWPLSTIESVSPLAAAPGATITITGKNLQHTYYIYIGTFACDILSKSESTVKAKVPEQLTEKSPISVYNLYRRTFVFDGGLFSPTRP
ncbi:MAG: IPT/TIG domain-containing protein [Tannerellaceae bacterium]|jgi:hypothetical protein|nr:IPT/TIG domain-containing protein [Tannerellaceae bacterium]